VFLNQATGIILFASITPCYITIYSVIS